MTDPLERLSDNDPAPPGLPPRSLNCKALCSKPGYRFQLQHFQIFDFLFFAVNLSTHADHARIVVTKTLAKWFREEYGPQLEELEQNPKPALSKLISFSGYHSEIMIIRLVDNFMSFLSEAIQACMFKKPALLRSKEQIRTEDVLSVDFH